MAARPRRTTCVRTPRRRFEIERLESRAMLVTLTGQWTAGDLDATHFSGAAVSNWTDSVNGVVANGEGSPRLVKNVLNGESVVRFAPEDGLDGFLVPAASSPMSGMGDYSIAVVFASTLASPDPFFTDNFNGFTAPAANFNGGQYQTSLPVAFGGDLPGWSKSGGNPVHVVNYASPAGSPANYAPMIWHDNVITQTAGVAGANATGKAYRVDFQASPAVYQASNQQTSATDGIKIDVLRANGSVLATHTHLPGAWAGSLALSPGTFQYTGDGSGEIRFRIGPSAPNSGRFGGAIDGLTLREVVTSPPITGTAWYDHLGLVDANQGGATADWGISLTGDGRVATGVGNPSATRFSTSTGLGNGRPHTVIVTRSGSTLSLTADGATTTLTGVSATPRAALDMAFGRLRDNRNYFRGDIAEIRVYQGALTASETTALNTALLSTYRNDPPVAVNDTYTLDEDATLTTTSTTGVLANDSDEENGALAVRVVQGPANGVLDLQSNGAFLYRPNANYSGSDSFTYIVSDGEFDSNVATVSITVTSVVDLPQAIADAYLVAAGTLTNFTAAQGVLANDFHPDGLTMSAVKASEPARGSVTLNVNGSFTYTPAAGFVGTDSFTYFVSDGPRSSATVEVELNVTATPVVISEFVASNESGLSTRIRATPTSAFSGGLRHFDWIELRNLSSSPLDIGGYHLTDNDANPTKWEFPTGTTIPASGQLVVFASGLELDNPTLDERGYLHTDFQLGAEGEYLALTAPDRTVLQEFPVYPKQFTDVSYGITASQIPGYFLTPTPGAANPARVSTDGPIVSDVTENPGALADHVNLVVTANVQTRHAAVQSVSLVYRVMFGAETSIVMRDDGMGADILADDGYYSAAIPANAAEPGEMLRWKVVARDEQNKSTSAPLALDTTGERQSPQYFGTIINDPALTTQLSDFHWFIQNPTGANVESGTRSSVFFEGEFYDNVFSGSRGATSQSVSKKSFKFEFNIGNDFRYATDVPRVTEINVNSTFQDKAYLRVPLTYDSYTAAGVPASDSFVWRIEQNGEFFSVANFVEQVDEDMLEKHGLDPDGALYKMFNGVSSATSGIEKKTREYEGNSDLQALVTGLQPSNPNREAFIFDNLDIPAMINYATAGIISQDFDRWAKNFYIYRDTNGSGEWTQIPHDKDLTFGKYFFDDQITGSAFAFESSLPRERQIPHPFQGAAANACCGGGSGVPNWMIDAIVTNPRTREMYLRRLRTLMDEQLQAPGTPLASRYFENQINQLAAMIAPDAALDLAKWGAVYGSVIDFPTAIQQLTTNYLDDRRVFLYETHATSSTSTPPTTLIDEFTDDVRYHVPVSNALGQTWTTLGFNDTAWPAGETGLGFQNQTGVTTCPINPTGDYASLLRTCVKPSLVNASATSIFTRLPFTLNSLAGISALTLQMKYDDAFIAYINGVEVARMNVSGSPSWNSTSTNHVNTSAVLFENFAINVASLPPGTLRAGNNLLAIHTLNTNTASSDMLVMPKLLAGSIATTGVGIPGAQTGSPAIEFGAIDFSPASTIQDEEYIELRNPGTTSVDISGWRFTGGATHEFKPGTVIPAGGSLYVSPNVAAFRARTTGPRGGQGLFVQGDYDGHISSFGETIELIAASGTIVATVTTPSMPSDLQQYLRVTEIHYHPADPTPSESAAGYSDGDLFEFIELQNISETHALNLQGLSFTSGVSFTFGDVASPPGGFVVLAANAEAFAARYGAVPIAGQYSGNLSNGGESLKLDDAEGGTILDFAYDDVGDDWHAATDGGGPSLVIIDPQLDSAAWDHGASWRPSFEAGGSPGERDMMLGDFDNDMDVDLSDLMFLQQHLGMNGATKALGDLTDDGTVDRRDLARFVASFGRSYVAPAAPAASAGAAVSAGAVVAQAKEMPASRKLRRASADVTATDKVLAAFRVRDTIRSSHGQRYHAVQE
jgi:hypothetical protein